MDIKATNDTWKIVQKFYKKNFNHLKKFIELISELTILVDSDIKKAKENGFPDKNLQTMRRHIKLLTDCMHKIEIWYENPTITPESKEINNSDGVLFTLSVIYHKIIDIYNWYMEPIEKEKYFSKIKFNEILIEIYAPRLYLIEVLKLYKMHI